MRVEPSKLNDKDLVQAIANAEVTYAECTGHHKANMNEQFVKGYRKAAADRGILVPEVSVLYKMGQFNGFGSY